MTTRKQPEADRKDWTFGQVLTWHMDHGTCPDGGPGTSGRRRTGMALAEDCGVSDRAVRAWCKDEYPPDDIETLERILFGDNKAFAELRNELREAWSSARRRREPSIGHAPSPAADIERSGFPGPVPPPGHPAGFFNLFLQHWRSGSGSALRGDPRYPGWTSREFLDRMEQMQSGISSDTLSNWLNSQNVPRPDLKDGILSVFFPNAHEGKGATQDDVYWTEMEAAWRAAWYGARTRQGSPGQAIASELDPGWSNLGGWETEGLVEFRLHPPEPSNDAQTHYVRATLRLGTAVRAWQDGVVAISLRDATLSIPSTSYQPAEGKMIGDRDIRNEHFLRTTGGALIVGPRDAVGCLAGDVLAGGYVAAIEPAVEGGEPLTVRIVARHDSFDVVATEVADEASAGKAVAVNKRNVLKALIFDVCNKDELGRAILAQRQMRRKQRI